MKLLFLLVLISSGITLQAQTLFLTDSESGATVYLHIDESNFKNHKHRRSSWFGVRETSEEYHDVIINTFRKAVGKYPSRIIRENVEQVYIYDQFDEEDAMMGAYVGRHGYFFKPKYDQGVLDTVTF